VAQVASSSSADCFGQVQIPKKEAFFAEKSGVSTCFTPSLDASFWTHSSIDFIWEGFLEN
jgi:hypothetical protein